MNSCAVDRIGDSKIFLAGKVGWRCYRRIRELQFMTIPRDEAMIERAARTEDTCSPDLLLRWRSVAGMVVRWVARLDSVLVLTRIRELFAERWRTRKGVNGVFGQFGAGNNCLLGMS